MVPVVLYQQNTTNTYHTTLNRNVMVPRPMCQLSFKNPSIISLRVILRSWRNWCLILEGDKLQKIITIPSFTNPKAVLIRSIVPGPEL